MRLILFILISCCPGILIGQNTEEKMDSLRIQPDPAQRLKLAEEIQEILLEDQPAVLLYYPVNKMAIHRRFNNANMYGKPNFVLMNDLEMVK